MHRDIKPQNLLIDPTCHILKVCDFGSAKKISEESKQSVSYITSRYYRAPELMFGAREYSTAIDIWSAGCVIAELIIGEPLFKGELANSQLIEIIKKLGSPTPEQILIMNPDYKRKNFPAIEPQAWDLIFDESTNIDALDLMCKLLVYEPDKRIRPIDALTHPWFDELRDEGMVFPHGNLMPDLFNFSAFEIKGVLPENLQILVPQWYRL